MIYISNTTLYTLNTYNLHWSIILYAKQDVKKAEFMGDVEFFFLKKFLVRALVEGMEVLQIGESYSGDWESSRWAILA